MRYFKMIMLGALLVSSSRAIAQERGPIESFGDDGKFFAKSDSPTESRKYYLLTRQSYLTEDSGGYDGDARVAIDTKTGGIETKQFHYIARCIAPFDNRTSVTFTENHQEYQSGDPDRPVDRKNPPATGHLVSYNLYWAACDKQFNKYK